MTKSSSDNKTPYIAVFYALVIPYFIAVIISTVVHTFAQGVHSLAFLSNSNGVMLASLGGISLILGLRWYSVAELGIRGGRPMMAGIGFAFLGWVGLLIARFISIGIAEGPYEGGLGLTFLYLLIIEAFCSQVWAFGLFFRTVADWRNPISAAILSGVLYGITAALLYGESFAGRWSLIYWVVAGIYYGMIRLRTGSFLGMVLVQAMQSLTVWYLLRPTEPISIGWLVGVSCFFYILITWRLFPKTAADFRV